MGSKLTGVEVCTEEWRFELLARKQNCYRRKCLIPFVLVYSMRKHTLSIFPLIICTSDNFRKDSNSTGGQKRILKSEKKTIISFSLFCDKFIVLLNYIRTWFLGSFDFLCSNANTCCFITDEAAVFSWRFSSEKSPTVTVASFFSRQTTISPWLAHFSYNRNY